MLLLGPLSCATTPDQSGCGSFGNEGILHIPQSSNNTGTSPSDCLVSYPGHSLGDVLPLFRDAIGIFYSPNRLSKKCLLFVRVNLNVLSTIGWLNPPCNRITRCHTRDNRCYSGMGGVLPRCTRYVRHIIGASERLVDDIIRIWGMADSSQNIHLSIL